MNRFSIIEDQPHSFPHCIGGPCDQGRKLCPTPQECRVIEDYQQSSPEVRRRIILGLVGMCAIAWVAVGSVLYVAWRLFH